ncbi:MAG TPA: DNA mismatch endonuclease Vsr [Geminicoccaceae bacterium]|nr:DNA mismatch endonuclease Vsr [Geminicoccus sp.]HMU53071.1 DNA mismatch endonuclease Vsr [Geminicoccaceae bacterium]
MRSIRKRDTQPELLVRRALHAAGLRFRLYRSDLPGNPDIIMPRRRLALLIHGCFWHQHPGCRLCRQPSRNIDYWLPKLARNVARDARTRSELEALGWRVLVIWECEARDPARVSEIITAIKAAAPT